MLVTASAVRELLWQPKQPEQYKPTILWKLSMAYIWVVKHVHSSARPLSSCEQRMLAIPRSNLKTKKGEWDFSSIVFWHLEKSYCAHFQLIRLLKLLGVSQIISLRTHKLVLIMTLHPRFDLLTTSIVFLHLANQVYSLKSLLLLLLRPFNANFKLLAFVFNL